MRKIMGHWTHRALAVPFDTWNTRIVEKKQMSLRAKNIILRMLNRCARALSHARTQERTHARMHARTHARTHAHKQTNTHSAAYTPLTTNPNLFHATLISPRLCCA